MFATSQNCFLAHGRCEAEKTYSFIVSLLSNRPTISRCSAHPRGGCARERTASECYPDSSGGGGSERKASPLIKDANTKRCARHSALSSPAHSCCKRCVTQAAFIFCTPHRKSCIYFIRCHAVVALRSGQETAAAQIHSLAICSRISQEHGSER